MTAKLSTGYCLLLLEAIARFMPLPTDYCQGDGIFYAYFQNEEVAVNTTRFLGYDKNKNGDSLSIPDKQKW